MWNGREEKKKRNGSFHWTVRGTVDVQCVYNGYMHARKSLIICRKTSRNDFFVVVACLIRTCSLFLFLQIWVKRICVFFYVRMTELSMWIYFSLSTVEFVFIKENTLLRRVLYGLREILRRYINTVTVMEIICDFCRGNIFLFQWMDLSCLLFQLFVKIY